MVCTYCHIFNTYYFQFNNLKVNNKPKIFLANPKLLEDKLWQKDLSADDFLKFDHCLSINIGTFNTIPVSTDDLVICTHGIRMTVKDLSKFILGFL